MVQPAEALIGCLLFLLFLLLLVIIIGINAAFTKKSATPQYYDTTATYYVAKLDGRFIKAL